ncbi:MAG TPA: tyrosine-type recombinase/integrase, partial [Nocardioides sp.]|nr:tyrosine-type recombinase/integrase [Nocardioides sp.]
PPEVVEALAPLAAGRPSRETLFLGPRGAPVRHRSFWSDVWLPSCARAGLEPRPRIHDLRHSHVAWLVAAGVPLPVIQARLGHESITTTIDTYGHLLPDLQRAAADAASRVLSGVRRPLGPGEPSDVLVGQGAPELEDRLALLTEPNHEHVDG